MNLDERDAIADFFGVAPEQVERDHLISHLLAVLSDRFGDRLHFIGGTALARTHLPGGRLSEDIDLVACGNRTKLAAELDAVLPRALGRAFGRLVWEPALSAVRDADAARLSAATGLSVKFQLLSATGRTLWPAQSRHLEQRYSDVPPARLTVPTRAAFAASKAATWHDRRAPRDLWDLWALAEAGAIDGEAAAIFARHGPTNRPPSRSLFLNAPSDENWTAQLAGQTRLTVTASEALTTVREAWATALEPDAMRHGR